MSLGYAEKLTFIEDVGEVGMSEIFDPPPILQQKIERLATMIQKSKHLVVFTGAGISTSCGIPDFRGPKGIWTLQREGKALPEASLPFHRAMPSMTHLALVELEKAGILKFIISQNIDGLHLRSGIPRKKISELHGNSFMETCPACGFEYLRDFEVGSIGLKQTSRRCSSSNCCTKLKDTVLDWEDALPLKEINLAEKHCKMADLVLCLGTSLQITPACNLPLKCLRGGGKIVIVNLQETPKDKKACIIIRGRVDKVVAGVLSLLNLRIPPFVRIDLLHTVFTQALSLDKRYVNWTLRVASVHGRKAPLPFIKSVEVSFSEGQKMKATVLQKQPFYLKRRTVRTSKPFDILLKLDFSNGCKCSSTQIKIPVDFKASPDSFKQDKNHIFGELRDRAIQDPSCGQNAVIETKAILIPKSEAVVHAIVTNIIDYEKNSKAFEAAATAAAATTTTTTTSSNGSLKRKKGRGGGHKMKRSRKGSDQRVSEAL